MSARRQRTVTAEAPARLDTVVRAAFPGLSRRLVRVLIAEGAVRVNGRRARKGALVQAGDELTLPEELRLVPEPALPIPVVFEDDALVAVDKPAGIPGHALDPRQRGTVAAFLLARYPEMAEVGSPLAPGLVHRLDSDTSGLLLAARTPAAHAAVRAALRARRVEKSYLAIVEGVAAGGYRIATPLAHDPGDRRRMMPAPPGARAWPAETSVEVLATGPRRSLVRAVIRTGVTHQVRVHLALLGLPVVGDPLYGRAESALARHALHAAALVLPHPEDGHPLRLASPLPAELDGLL